MVWSKKCVDGFYNDGYCKQIFTSQTLLDWMDSCELLVDYCDVLSAVWTLILTAPIYSRGSIGANNVMLNFSVSVLMKKTNSSTSWMAWRLIFFLYNFHFCVRYYFKLNKPCLQLTSRTSNFVNWAVSNWDSRVYVFIYKMFCISNCALYIIFHHEPIYIT